MDAGQTVPGFYKEGPDKAEFFVHSPFAWRLNDREVEDRNQDSIVMQVTFVEGGVETYGILGSDANYETLTKIVETTKLHKREHRLLWDFLKLFHHCSYLSLGPDRGKDETEVVPEGQVVVRDAEPRWLRNHFDQRPDPRKGQQGGQERAAAAPPGRQPSPSRRQRQGRPVQGHHGNTVCAAAQAARDRNHRRRREPLAGGAGRHRHRDLAARPRRMTMPHDWLQTWGDAIEPDQLSGSFAIRFRNFLINEAAGLASITGARRDGRREIVILEVETNRPQRPAYSILHREPVAVVLFEDDTFAPTVLSLRSDFPDTPHQNWMPDGMPFSLCVDDRPWQDARPLYTPAELLHRIMKWFERAGRGGLHDLRQPLDPFFMRQGIDVVMPRNLFELAPSQRLELVGTRHDTDNLAVITVRLPLPGEQGG